MKTHLISYNFFDFYLTQIIWVGGVNTHNFEHTMKPYFISYDFFDFYLTQIIWEKYKPTVSL